MGDDPRSAIAALLARLQPRSLLLLSPDPDAEWRRWCERHSGAELTVLTEHQLPQLETLGRYDMALVIGLIEQLDKSAGMQLIGRLRNVHAEHVFVLVGEDERWPASAWYGLALQRIDSFVLAAQPLTLYGYDLATYNRARSWNNPRHWANPENWGKYWW